MVQEQTGPQKKGVARKKSKVAYPWFSLNQSLELARIVEEKGGGTLALGTLAMMAGSSVTSGFFRMQRSAAKMYGFIAEHNGMWSTTDRARRILHPVSMEDKAKAEAEAFMDVPLFRQIMQEFTGRPLPPIEGLKDTLSHKFGIVPARLETAAKVLIDSARDANMLRRMGNSEREYLVPTDMDHQSPKPEPQVINADPLAPPAQARASSPYSGVSGRGRPQVLSEQLAGETIMMFRLTTEERDILEPEEIADVYAAIAKAEGIKRKALKRFEEKKAAEPLG